MNAVIYARYSSSSQRDASIDEQIQVCEQYAQKYGYDIIEKYCDRALSGRTSDRPALNQMFKDSAHHRFEVVLVYSVDRLGRELYDMLDGIRRLQKNGITLCSATEPFGNTAAGRLSLHIMMSYAQYYSEELGDKIKRGMAYNASRCIYNGGGVPLGYRIGADRHFEIDPDTAPIVQLIFQMYANGKTVTEITTLLNQQGFRSSKGAAFNKNSLHTILKNRRYLGYYIHKGHEIKDGVPQIIPDDLFDQVAAIMEKNRKAPARARAKEDYLLTTKLFCGHCKEMMTGFSGTGKLGKVYHYYICNGRKKKTCDKKMVKKSYIEDLVVSECRRLLTPENIRKIAAEVMAIFNKSEETDYLRQLKKSLSKNKRRQDNTLDAITESDSPSHRKRLAEKLTELEKEQAVLEAQIAKEEQVLPNISEQGIRFFLTELRKGNADDIRYRKTLIDVFVNRIYLYDDRITITYNSGDHPVTINDRLLSAMEAEAAEVEGLFLDGSAPPETPLTGAQRRDNIE